MTKILHGFKIKKNTGSWVKKTHKYIKNIFFWQCIKFCKKSWSKSCYDQKLSDSF